jgi:hypothetical protein
MQSFSELAGAELHWEFDGSPIIPTTGDRHYVLFSGSEPVVTAQCKWEKLVYFQVALEAGEGTYFVHMDLTASPLTAVVWKAGTSFSGAGFSLTSWSSYAFAGTITTAGGRTLTWRPNNFLGMATSEGSVVAPGGAVLLSITPKSGSNTSGKMRISAALAADPDRAALSALAFALCNEQAFHLHLAPGLGAESRFRWRLRAPRPDDGIGAMGAVLTGKFGLFVMALFVGSMTLWIWSATLWAIDFALLFIVVIGLMFRHRAR